MIDQSSAIHPAVKEFLEAREIKARYKGEAIAKRHGISRARLYQLVDDHEKGNGPVLTNSNGTEVSPLSETVEADTSPTVPDRNEASEVASGKEPGIRARVIALAKQGHNVTQIAREIGIARQNVYLHLPEELRPRAVKRNEAEMRPLSETIGAHAMPMVPEAEPGQQAAVESAATQG